MTKLTVPQLWQAMSEIQLHGWIADDEGEVIRREAEKLEPGQIYLEVGVAYGKSLATVCYYAKEGVEIWGVDRLNWKERDENLAKLELAGKANFIEGDSQAEALRWQRPLDLLFIDGDHTYYGIMRDLCSWLPHVKHGGRIMLHDYDTSSGPGIMRAVHEVIQGHPAYKDNASVRSIYTFTKV